MNYNKVMVGGRLTRDIELKYTSGGVAVASISLAINRRFNKGDEVVEEVSFIDVTAFSKQAETLAEYVKKGDPIFIEGRLKTDSWDDKDTGKKRSKLTVILEGFQFISGKKDSVAEEQPRQRQQEPKPSHKPEFNYDDDDVQF